MNTYNKIMKIIWLVMAAVGFILVTVMCFVDGLDKWVYYYPFVILALGMYFFKAWMMKRMERHLEYMSKKEEESH
jgi:SNF family Na+-dependent transporter